MGARIDPYLFNQKLDEIKKVANNFRKINGDLATDWDLIVDWLEELKLARRKVEAFGALVNEVCGCERCKHATTNNPCDPQCGMELDECRFELGGPNVDEILGGENV